MLNIIKTVENGKAVFTLEGRLDTTTASALEKELAESLEGVSELCFDFAGLDYISSAGLRVLLAAQKTMNRQVKTAVHCTLPHRSKEVFKFTLRVIIKVLCRKCLRQPHATRHLSCEHLQHLAHSRRLLHRRLNCPLAQ